MNTNSPTSETKPSGSKSFRWFILFLMSFVIFGSYYVYDALSTLQETMKIHLGLSAADYGLIVGMYSFPNTFLLMAVVGGIILDRIGVRITGFLFALCCALGALLTAYGASDTFMNHGPGYNWLASMFSVENPGSLYHWTPQLLVMMAGRLLFGLGSETLIIVQNKVIAKWFKGKELAFAFGINLAVCRLGTAMALIGSPILVQQGKSWVLALWVAAIIMLVSFFLFVLFVFVDKRSHFSREKDQKARELVMGEEEKFKLADLGQLLRNRSFLFICCLCVTFYSAVFPFQSFCADMLHNKFKISMEWSGILTSTVIWGTIFFTPLFGGLVDRFGKRATMMIYGSLMLVAVHLTLGLTALIPFIPMFVLGIAFSLVPAAMWPAVAVIVEEKRLGTAYGLMTSIQNLGLFAFPILAGWVTDLNNPGITSEMLEKGTATLDYTWTMMLFAGIGLMGLVFAFLLKRVESGPKGHGIESPSKLTV
jgi:MFS family permease